MPNWCDCELAVRGEREAVERFMDLAQNDKSLLDMNRFIPYPEEYAKLDREAREWSEWAKQQTEGLSGAERTEFYQENKRPKDGYNQGGYEWCWENWGTKWNFCDTTIIDDHELEGVRTVVYRFDTAWSPPLPIVDKMSELFPDLEFELNAYECGCAFQVDAFWTDGEKEYETTKDYHGNRGG